MKKMIMIGAAVAMTFVAAACGCAKKSCCTNCTPGQACSCGCGQATCTCDTACGCKK